MGLRQFPQQYGAGDLQQDAGHLLLPVSTEPLSDELIERISPLRGAFSDIRPVINYYRVTRKTACCSAAPPALWSIRRTISPPRTAPCWRRSSYLRDVKIDFASGGPMACSANLFPQIGTLRDHNNVFTSGTPASASPRRTSCAKSSPKGSTAVPTAIAC